jgi:serine phosphatase RsbU (regulator of sigma subunit)
MVNAGRASVTVWISPADNARDGGDWCETVPLSEHEIALTIGDVSGHGESVAGTKRTLQAAVLRALSSSHVPSEVLARANMATVACGRDVIATAIVAVYDSRIRTLRVSNAGHPPPLVVTHERAAFLTQRQTNLPLGVFSHYRSTEVVLALPPGAIVIFYTDGMTERDRDLDRGEAELVAAARDAYDRSVADIAGSVAGTLFATNRGADDAAIMVLRLPGIRAGRIEPPGRRTLRAESLHVTAAALKALPWQGLVRSAISGERIVRIRAKPRRVDPFTPPEPAELAQLLYT